MKAEREAFVREQRAAASAATAATAAAAAAQPAAEGAQAEQQQPQPVAAEEVVLCIASSPSPLNNISSSNSTDLEPYRLHLHRSPIISGGGSLPCCLYYIPDCVSAEHARALLRVIHSPQTTTTTTTTTTATTTRRGHTGVCVPPGRPSLLRNIPENLLSARGRCPAQYC